MPKFSFKILSQFWQIARPYWFSEEKQQARWLLLLLVILSFFTSSLLVIETIQRGEIISALAARDSQRFWQTMRLLGGIIIASVPLISFNLYVEQKLGLYWRKWLTENLTSKYLKQKKYYYLNRDTEIDNPDQRIAEDVNNFTQQSLFLLVLVLSSLTQLIAFVGIIWLIYKPLVLFLLIYSILGTSLLLLLFGRILTVINVEQLKKEADFRFGLIRIRDSAESIAFYRGENTESRQIKQKLLAALNNFDRLIKWQLGLDFFQNGFQFSTMLIPAIILAPSIFAGNIEVGAITQSQIAFERIWLSLSLAIIQFEKITTLAAGIRRLIDLIEYLEYDRVRELPARQAIKIKENPRLSCANLSLKTPDLKTDLIDDLSLEILAAERLLIVGDSGVGKSSLVRAIAGLWNSGMGTINRPHKEDILFLPQRPYLILGSLEKQLLYPKLDKKIDKEKLWLVLEKVNLIKTVSEFEDLSVEKNWSQVLSRGEQQRLAFARLLLQQPKYAILDEATSALDRDNQDLLYRELAKTNITFVSVGHRSSLVPYHRRVLELTKNRSWSLFNIEEQHKTNN